MKLTKYEHTYNPYHEICSVNNSPRFYASPITRIILIVLINISIILFPLGTILLQYPYKLAFIIVDLSIIVGFSITIEYNPLKIFFGISYTLYIIFGKCDLYKKLIRLYNDYSNVLEFEKRISVEYIRQSVINCTKIYFKKNNNIKGYILKNKIIIYSLGLRDIINYDINSFENIKEFYIYIKDLLITKNKSIKNQKFM